MLLLHLSIASLSLWHKRLGHPHDQVLHTLFPKFHFSTSNKCTFVNSCMHCLHDKMHKLPFPKSQFSAKSQIELVHTNL